MHQRRRPTPARGIRRDDGVTLIELLAAVLITSIMVGALAGGFVVALRTTMDVRERNTRAADIQLLSTYFTPDAQSVAGSRPEDPSTPPPDIEERPPGFLTPTNQVLRPVCGADPTQAGIYTFNRNWEGGKYRDTVTYEATGVGDNSQLLRHECTNGGDPVTVVVARYFGNEGNDQAAVFVFMRCTEDGSSGGVPEQTCRLTLQGAYDYTLDVDRRSPGVATGNVSCPPRPPGAMAAPQGSPGNQKVTISWNAPLDDGCSTIDLYEVQAIELGTSQVYDASVTTREFTGLQNGVNYRFRVRAHNEYGWGPWSADSVSMQPGTTVPGPPTIGTATPGNRSATVTFAPPVDDGGQAITGYRVQARDTVSGDVFEVDVAGSPGRVPGLTNGQTYRLTVRAQNGLGFGPPSEQSNEVVPEPGVPDPPRNVVAVHAAQSGNRVARITWDKPLDDGGTAIETYNIYVSSGDSAIGILATETRSYEIPDLPAGEPLTFTVTAVNSIGESLESEPSNVLVLTDVPGIIVPRPTLTVGAGEGKAHLEWSLPPENGLPVQSYDIERQCVGTTTQCVGPVGGRYDTTPVNGIVTSARQWDLNNEPKSPAVVSYRIRARNAKGVGEWSEYSNPLTLGGPPAFPDPITVTWDGRPGGLQATWSPPANDGGSPITGYVVDVYECAAASSTPPGATPAQLLAYRCLRDSPPVPPTNPVQATTIRQTITVTDPSVTVTGLVNGKHYNVKVRTQNAVGLSGRSPFGTSSASPKAVPLPPINVGGRDANLGTGTYAEVWWTQATQPAGVVAPSSYIIEVDCTCAADGRQYPTTTLAPTPASPVLIGAAPGNANALPPGVPLQFIVYAVNPTGTSAASVPSGPVTLLGVPSAPRNVQATGTGGSGQVLVSWLAPLTDNGSAITGYKVSYCQGAACVPTAVGSTTVSTGSTGLAYTVEGLTNGATYRFAVRATNAIGDSVASSAVTASPSTNTTAPIIGIAEATGTSGQAIARWSPPLDTGGAPITGYVIDASTGQQSMTGPAATQVTFEGLENGTAVTFTVVARNDNGDSPSSAASNPVVPGAPPGSAGPVEAFPTRTSGEVRVTWNEAEDNGAEITGYRIVANCSCSTDGTEVMAAADVTERIVTGLEDGAFHTFTVTAVNVWEDGPPTTSAAVVPIGAPDAPTGVVATATGSPGQVSLTWTAPANTHGSPILEYVVVASTGQTAGQITTTSTTMSGLDDGVPVTFTVAAVSEAGSSPPSAPSNQVTPFGPPSAPTDVVATATGTRGEVSLSWTPPDDNGNPILDYRILTSSGDEFTVPVGSTTTLTGLDEGTPVSFVVIARNAAGQGTPSGASNTVTPAGRPDAPSGFDVAATGIGGEVEVTFNPSVTYGTPVTQYTATIACGGCALDGNVRAVTSGDVISGLGNGTTVTVTVVAESAVGSSSPVSDTATTPVPASAPTLAGSGYTGLRGQAVVWWQPAADGGSPITSYEIRSLTTSTTIPVVPSPCPATVLTGNGTVTPVPAGRTCATTNRAALPDNTSVSFKVRAVTGVAPFDDGNPTTFDAAEGWSNQTIAFTTPNVPGPIPAGMTATATGTSDEIQVTWSPPAADNRSPVIDYLIEVTRGATVVRTVAPAPVLGTTSYVITALPDLPVGQTYTVRMKARNDVGVSASYRQVTGVVPTP